ncbi:MAG: hypothetical protein H6Q67_2046 [Firmicutes bacterium]|nr:hypothetical protein [Bacillota bacterium]
MTTPDSFRRAYDKIEPILKQLQARAQYQFEDIKSVCSAHYEGRLKSVPSLLSKAETGKYSSIREMEDLFAATIAVPLLSQIKEVQEMVKARFVVLEVKSHRKKNPREFVYDDLHMILKLKDDALIRDKSILDYKIELQIKTLLQLAWWHLEHDLVYKTDRVSWQKSRVFGQVKAMLELADSMVANIDQVAVIQDEEEFQDYLRINEVAECLEKIWIQVPTPFYDLRRAAETVLLFLNLTEISAIEMVTILGDQSNKDLITAKSITPCQAVFIALFRGYKATILQNIKTHSLLITEEMIDFAADLSEIPDENVMKL